MNHQALAIVAAVLAISGCGGGGAPEPSALVYQPTGSLQCIGGGKSLEDVERSLQGAGVPVRDGFCAADGLGHVAACGAADGSIVILEIPQSQSELALRLGFNSVTGLPYVKVPCK
jgi:hypothetical protein